MKKIVGLFKQLKIKNVFGYGMATLLKHYLEQNQKSTLKN